MATTTLSRPTFETSRALEYFTEKELRMQIGTGPERWPVAMLKELIDNALDACESAGVPPEITVQATPESFSVRDNGPGLPTEIIERSLDYMTRVSTNTKFVAPTRGQLGNALKCLYAAPYVLTGTGSVHIETEGTLHTIDVSTDEVRAEPDIKHNVRPGSVKSGTRVTVRWPKWASLLQPHLRSNFYDTARHTSDFGALLDTYSLLNPHATFTLVFDDTRQDWKRRDAAWRKFGPADPTSAHWYDVPRFAELVGGYIRAGYTGTVRDFLAEFDGLSSSKKRSDILQATGTDRLELASFGEGGTLHHEGLAELLKAMQDATTPVSTGRLGQIGKSACTEWMDERFTHVKRRVSHGEVTGARTLPYTLEVAFGQKPEGHDRTLACGLNFTPALENPFGWGLTDALHKAHIGADSPVFVAVHLAFPDITFTERGKGRAELPDVIARDLADQVRLATKEWTATQEKERRKMQRRIKAERRARKRREKAQKRFASLKDACFHHMEQAYLQASDDGSLPANARQIMYAIRPLVKRDMDGDWYSDDRHFQSEIIRAYFEAYPDKKEGWDVVWKARGKMLSPHREQEVKLGTIGVREYDIPAHEYGAVLYVEKEGFDPVLRAAGIGKRFDVAIMSTAGQSVDAARRLVDKLSARGIPTYVLHDFDYAGFSIAHTLHTGGNTHTYESAPLVHDIGLRLADAQEYGLLAEGTEPQTYEGQNKDPRESLQAWGATEEEQAFLCSDGRPGSWRGQRVELNALSSAQLVELIERRLTEHGVAKVVPEESTLRERYQKLVAEHRIEQELGALRRELEKKHRAADVDVPADLPERVRKDIEGQRTSWDEQIKRMARALA